MIHRYLRPGHLEKVYENALTRRLRKRGLEVQSKFPLTVYDEGGTILGEFKADLSVEDRIIVELKTCSAIVARHVSKLPGYMKSGRIENGLLINFGTSKFYIKKYVMNTA